MTMNNPYFVIMDENIEESVQAELYFDLQVAEKVHQSLHLSYLLSVHFVFSDPAGDLL